VIISEELFLYFHDCNHNYRNIFKILFENVIFYKYKGSHERKVEMIFVEK